MRRMRSFRAFFLGSACAALLVSSAGPSWAQPTDQQLAEARTLAIQGRSALLQKKFADAIDPLRKAAALDPNPQIKLDLAKALDGAGKLVEASTILNELKESPDKQIQASARKLVTDIEGRIPWIMVTVKGPKEGEATILIDGKETDASFEVPIDPGEHVIRAEAEGWKPSEKQATAGNGEHLELEISLERDPAAAEEEEEVKPVEAPPPASTWPRPNLPVMVALGTGAAGVAIGSLFGILAFTSTSSAKERCSGNICPNDPETVDARDAAVRNGNISTAGFIIGGLGVGTAAVLYYMTQMKAAPAAAPAPAKESATIHPWIGPGQAGVFGTF